MATTLTPVSSLAPAVSATIDYEVTPDPEVPKTEFPYPEKNKDTKPEDDSTKKAIDSGARRGENNREGGQKSDPAQRGQPHDREGSGITLVAEDEHKVDHDESHTSHVLPVEEKQKQTRKDGEPAQSEPYARPIPPLRRFETDTPQRVGVRPVLSAATRKSTGARPSAVDAGFAQSGTTSDDFDSSDTNSNTSSEDEEHREGEGSRRRNHPGHRDLGPAELNRTRWRPKRQHKHHHGRLSVGNEHFRGRGKIAKDGRLNISVNEASNTGYLAKALGSTIQSHLRPNAKTAQKDEAERKQKFAECKDTFQVPRMNIVIMVIGSRGDIQPFLKIGQILRDKYHHRVRIATHPAFRKFVQEDIGLEFFSIGGDPSELMSFMVKNPGLVPSFDTLTSGEVGRRREQMFEMFQGFWRACINTTDEEKDTANLKLLGNRFPFVADAIIANPPSFAHFHCAERLGIPLHLVFTFPYSPTQAFPHPLANIKASNVDREYTNLMSYPLVDLMTWQGLGDLVNRFRVKTLGLEPVSTLWAPGQLTRLQVPTTYLWSPGLVPKPEDWGPEIDIAGYVFLELASSFKPPEDLTEFLRRSDEDTRPIIYIGFGSISGIDDPRAFCTLIFEAVVRAGVRAVVSRGWGGMGDGMDIPDGVFMVDNVPHDWLFPQLDAVVHHGGAGTTAAGLKLGKPTMIVPFFGDQPFWAAMVMKAGAGPKNVWPLKQLNVERFSQGIRECLEPEAKEQAKAIAKSIEVEGDGAENAVDSFHRSLTLKGKHSMRCGIFKDRVAAWRVKRTDLKLSTLAADLLVGNKQMAWADLELLRHKEWTDFQGPGEPITGAGGVVVAAFQEAFHGLSSIPQMTKKDMQRVERRKRKGRTVADAVVMPGRVAHNLHVTSSHGNKSEGEDVQAPVNLTGEAEPPRKPTLPGVIAGTDRAARPGAVRSDTDASGPVLPTPVVVMKDVGKGVGHSLKVILLLPGDIFNAVTLGFRNAPRLYGDRTVRPPPRTVDGLRQGVRVAGKELWFGFYDGVTGVVRIPHLDVHEDGVSGLPKGIARGVGGFVLKPIAGTLGFFNFTTRGVYASIRKQLRDTEKTERWLRRARMHEGGVEVQELKKQEQRSQQGARRVPAGTAPHGELEAARTHAVQQWAIQGQPILAEVHERENRSYSIIDPFKRKVGPKPGRTRTR